MYGLLPGMAISAQRFLPDIADIFGMLEFKPRNIHCRWGGGGTLIENCVARIAIAGDRFASGTHMLASVATETADVCHMIDVVGVCFPTHLHAGKEITTVLQLQFLGGKPDQFFFLSGY